MTFNVQRSDIFFNALFGPSHAVRLKHAIRTGQLPDLIDEESIFGVGGMPIWNKRVFREFERPNLGPFFIVGDFRFGNKVLRQLTDERPPSTDFLGIDRNLITPSNDAQMFSISFDAIRRIRHKFPEGRLLFWDLTLREFEARSAGRYFGADGKYRHPGWNLDAVLAECHDVAADTRDLRDQGRAAFIDSSCHPSIIGWAYIISHMMRQSAQESILNRVPAFHESFKTLLRSSLFGSPYKRVSITGNSKFTRIFKQYLDRGIFCLPSGFRMVSLQEAVAEQEIDPECHCLYFPSVVTHAMDRGRIMDEIRKTRRNVDRLRKINGKLSVLPYDNWAAEIVSNRPEFLGLYVCPFPEGRMDRLEAAWCPPDQNYRIGMSTPDADSFVELNNTYLPTTLGLLEFFLRALEDVTPYDVRKSYRTLLGALL